MLIHVLLVLIIIGALLYLSERVLPIDGSIKLIIRVLVLLGVLIWLLQVFGVNTGLPRLG